MFAGAIYAENSRINVSGATTFSGNSAGIGGGMVRGARCICFAVLSSEGSYIIQPLVSLFSHNLGNLTYQ